VSTFECGVCWNVYDSALGDDVAQIPAGTEFADLPESWRCPRCDSPKEKYLATVSAAEVAERTDAVDAAGVVDPRVERLVAEYRVIAETRMKGLPIVNPRLEVEAVGFRETPAGLVGALVTPWSVNAILFPVSGVAPTDGHHRVLPGGSFRFLPQRLDSAGYVELSSLFSPVFQFDSQAAAVAATRAALEPMVTPPKPLTKAKENPEASDSPPAPPSTGPASSRRELLKLFRRQG